MTMCFYRYNVLVEKLINTEKHYLANLIIQGETS